jgi:hypothetical protein
MHPAALAARRVVVIGGVAGGASCAARLRRLTETAEITLFERGEAGALLRQQCKPLTEQAPAQGAGSAGALNKHPATSLSEIIRCSANMAGAGSKCGWVLTWTQSDEHLTVEPHGMLAQLSLQAPTSRSQIAACPTMSEALSRCGAMQPQCWRPVAACPCAPAREQTHTHICSCRPSHPCGTHTYSQCPQRPHNQSTSQGAAIPMSARAANPARARMRSCAISSATCRCTPQPLLLPAGREQAPGSQRGQVQELV